MKTPREVDVRRRSRPRRTAAEWGLRGLSALAVAAMGYVGVAQSFAYGLRSRDPERAYAVAPWDGRISAALAQTFISPEVTPATRTRADHLARLALRQDATAVSAASALGISTQIAGETSKARRLVNYAEKLSRRDLTSQIWLIEDAVARGDVSGALRHYDISLRTSSRSSDLLFPVLAAAANDPAVRPALIRTLVARPPWSALFVEYAAANGPDPRATAVLFRALGQTKFPLSALSRTLLTDTLASRGFFEDAWSFYASFRHGADRRNSRDASFTADLSNPTVFDWRPLTDVGISASLQRGMLSFAAPAGVGGALVEQAQMLPPGKYRIAGHSVGIDQAPEALPYWSLRCGDGRELGRVDLPNSALAGGVFAGKFTVPIRCSMQKLVLTARPSNAISGVSGQIDRVKLSPDNVDENGT